MLRSCLPYLGRERDWSLSHRRLSDRDSVGDDSSVIETAIGRYALQPDGTIKFARHESDVSHGKIG